MQRSSTALAVSVLALIAAYLPAFLTPDALAQSVSLPAPDLISTAEIDPSVQTSATPPAQQQTPVPAPAASISKTSVEQLIIPSIGLDDPIVPVGVDQTGAMAVPSGATDGVGWYDGGPEPGQVGSAVLDAHVFAAFSRLNEVKVGDSIYVQENGASLRFVVTAVKLYALSDITPQDLFAQTSDRDLNLITCAGQLTPDHSTYDHRLVIYTTLEN